MSNNKFSYILLDQNKSHLEEDSDYSENEYKNKNFKIQKYEKFKPKSILKEKNNTKSLKGAENKVKYLLSMFLKNIETENENSGNIYKPNYTLKSKDKDSAVSFKKKELKKINTATNSKKLGRTSSFNYHTNKYNSYKITENNKFLKGECTTPKSSLFSNFFHSKKVGFHLNNANNQKDSNNINVKRAKKKNSINISSTMKNKERKIVQRTSSYNKAAYRTNRLIAINESPTINHRKISLNKRGNLNKPSINNNRSLIKKGQLENKNNTYINFKNDEQILKNNKEYKNKRKNTFKNLINNIVNNNFNKNLKNKNILNDSNNHSIISESSDNMNKRSIDIKQSIHNKTNDESNKKEINSIISKHSSIIKKGKYVSSSDNKKHSIDLTDLSYKMKSSIKPKKTSDIKNSLDIAQFKRSETTISKNKYQFMNKTRLRRLSSNFKSLKQQIKKIIILRPEKTKSVKIIKKSSTKSITKKNNKYKKCKSNTQIHNYFKNIIENNNNNNNNNNKSSKSNKNIINIKTKLSVLSQNSRNSKDNISVQTSSVKKLKTETENQETAKTDKKESSISASSEDYSPHSIQRKNNMFLYEKYRILIHKGILYDSLDDEEFEDEEDINSLYLDPHSFFTITFDSILFIMTIASLFNIPLYLAISHDFCRKKFGIIDGINLFIESLYVLDLFLGFFRAYYNWDEQLIKKNKDIAFKYLTGWFLFDLISSIPAYTITKINEPLCNENELSSGYYNIVLNNLNYLFMGNRLFKILKIFSDNQAWKIVSNKVNVFWNMMINIFLVLAALNYTACLYIFIARNSYPNWILHSKLETRPFKDIYICAIYILIMALTTVGYGDITCYSLSERIFQLLLLVIGIMAYSWLISSFSNYIKKLNERTADFEKKKSILDEIKINNPNLPDSLYERILRYLKFKNFHEKKLKNIIYDCLPVGLKNNLISEMYKPIIKNFIFFKNFQNTDFIVRVILCFKPIIAYKNDILVNEGDMIEEIMFVKRGILSVELPINMTNPQENINKYLNMPLLKIEKGPNVEKIGNSTIIGGNSQKYKKLMKSINSIDRSNNKSSGKKVNSFMNNSTFGSSLNYTLSLGNRQTLSKKSTIKIETTYVKILGIRENEHFGDVLMFLEQRSPLRLRVRSKKAELFFLKKMDAVKISTSYQNIWTRINKKSVFNFEQIKKSIRKIVEIYCSVKKVSSFDDDDVEKMSNGIYGPQYDRKESSIAFHPQNYDLNTSALNLKKKNTLKRNKSFKDDKKRNYNNFFKNNIIDDDYFEINNKNINNKKNCGSTRIEKKGLDISATSKNKLGLSHLSSSSSSSSEKKDKIKSDFKNEEISKNKIYNKKLLDAFKGNYKFYKGLNNNNNIHQNELKENPSMIIKEEEPDKESSLTLLKYTNSLQQLTKISTKKKILNTISFKKSIGKENPIKEIEDEEEDLNNRNIKKSSSSLMDWNKNNTNNYDVSISNSSEYEREINMEIYPGEIINVNREESLLFRKINPNGIENLADFDDNYEFKNTKIEKLINSSQNINQFIKYNNGQNCINLKENKKQDSLKSKENNEVKSMNSSKSNLSEKSHNKYDTIINDNDSSNLFYSQKNNNLNLKLSSKNIESPVNMQMKVNWDSKILSINKSISLQFDSSYENSNLISGERLIKSKSLQNKLKSFLIDETSNFSRFNTNTNSIIKKTNSFAERDNLHGNKNMLHSFIKPIKKLSLNNINIPTKLNNMNIKNKIKKKIRNCSSLANRRSRTISSNLKNFEKTYSFHENSNLRPKKNNNKFKTGIGAELFGNSYNKLAPRKSPKNNVINTNTNAFNSSSKELQKKIIRKRRNSIIIMNFPNNKKKDDLLSQINFNIQKTNQNLNNPDEFYSSYFNFLLEGEMGKNNNLKNNNKKLLSTSVIVPKKKEKINRNKSYIIKK